MGLINNAHRRTVIIGALLVILTTLAGIVSPIPARAALSREGFEDCLLDRANRDRSASGAGNLTMAYDIVSPVRDWSEWMRFNEFQHMSDALHQEILPDSATRWGENVAMSGYRDMSDCDRIHDMWMNSLGHRANILNPKYSYVAIGAYVDDSGWWVTQLFFDAPGYSDTAEHSDSCHGTFCDDDGSIFEDAIESISAAGVTRGCNPPTNDQFCPTEPVTRGEMAAFLARALGLPEGYEIDFQDAHSSIFADQIIRLAGADITKGCNPPTNSRYCPDELVTRKQMAAFLVRALDLPHAEGTEFIDDNGSVFEADIEALAAAGITTGCNPPENTKFCPNDYVTRGQMAAFLARALGL